MTLEQLQAGTGLARTGAGDPIAVAEVLHAAAEATVIPAVLDPHGALIAMSHGHRLASPAQRLALAARDGGCTAPGCSIPPDWCQSHHVIDWRERPITSIDQLTLACAYHHLIAIPAGWRVDMINGIPHWTAPPWLDPDQTPRRNTTHHVHRIEFTPPEPPGREPDHLPEPPPPDPAPPPEPEPEPDVTPDPEPV